MFPGLRMPSFDPCRGAPDPQKTRSTVKKDAFIAAFDAFRLSWITDGSTIGPSILRSPIFVSKVILFAAEIDD